MQPDFTKGHYRLGSALLLLRRHAEAIAAFEGGLHRAPHNDELRTALRGARAAQEAARREALLAAKQADPRAGVPPGGVSPSKAAPPKVDYEKAAAAAARANELALKRAADAAGSGAPQTPGSRSEPAAERGPSRGAPNEADAPAAPTSVQQFEREWRTLCAAGSLDAQREWLGRLRVAEYAPLFKESLTEATLTSLVECMRRVTQRALAATDVDADHTAAFACSVLEGLATTRRFSMLLMFLDRKQRTLAHGIFSDLARLGAPAPDSVAKAWEAPCKAH